MVNINPTSKNIDKWIIVKHNKGNYLQSELLLRNGFSHAFFTKKIFSNEIKDLKKFNNVNNTTHYLTQVHGTKILNASESKQGKIPKADSLVSDHKSQSLWIYTADCIPILIADTNTGIVSVIHAGWRGLKRNIIKKTIKFIEEKGSKRKNLIFALGPAISGKNYEVSQNVIEEIYKSFDNRTKALTENMIKEMIIIKFTKSKPFQKNYFLDIRMTAKNHLLLEGLKKEQISTNRNCTYSDHTLFHSWRRDKTKSRQWSFIEAN